MNRRPWAFFRSVLHLRRTGGNGTLNKPQDGSPDSQDTSVNQDSDAVAGAGSRKHKRPVELEAAEERQAWSESPEFGKLKRAQRLILGLTPVAAFIGSLSPLIYENEFRNRGFSSILTAAVIGAGIWLYLSLYY